MHSTFSILSCRDSWILSAGADTDISACRRSFLESVPLLPILLHNETSLERVSGSLFRSKGVLRPGTYIEVVNISSLRLSRHILQLEDRVLGSLILVLLQV
jgi:hypothetical protein